jgi:hypothetical protein
MRDVANRRGAFSAPTAHEQRVDSAFKNKSFVWEVANDAWQLGHERGGLGRRMTAGA